MMSKQPQPPPHIWKRNTGPANEARRGADHPLPDNVAKALTDALALLNQWQTRGFFPLGTSARQFSREINVSDKSVRRWLHGECHPHPDHHPHILKWAKDMRRTAQVLTRKQPKHRA